MLKKIFGARVHNNRLMVLSIEPLSRTPPVLQGSIDPTPGVENPTSPSGNCGAHLEAQLRGLDGLRVMEDHVPAQPFGLLLLRRCLGHGLVGLPQDARVVRGIGGAFANRRRRGLCRGHRVEWGALGLGLALELLQRRTQGVKRRGDGLLEVVRRSECHRSLCCQATAYRYRGMGEGGGGRNGCQGSSA